MESAATASGGNIAFTVAKIKYTFFAASDGSSVSAVTVGEGMDSADKSTNKAMAAAMKYALFQTFCIPTEEMQKDDPDMETVEPSEPAPPEDATQSPSLICEECHQEIVPTAIKNGKILSAENIANETYRRYGRELCVRCWEIAKLNASKEGPRG